MVTFPDFTFNDLNKVPISVDTSGYSALQSFAGILSIAVTGIGKLLYLSDTEGAIDARPKLSGDYPELLAFVGAGILSGLEVTLSGANSIVVSSGEYAYFDGSRYSVVSVPSSVTKVVDAGVLNVDGRYNILINGNAVNFVRVGASGIGCMLGVLEIRGGAVVDYYPVRDYFDSSFASFAKYVNDLGVWYEGLHVGNNEVNGLKTSGGYVFSYSMDRPFIINATNNISMNVMKSDGGIVATVDQVDIAFFKKWYDLNEHLINGTNEYAVWILFVNANGKFFLWRPTQHFRGNEEFFYSSWILHYIRTQNFPSALTDAATPCLAIAVSGTMTNISELRLFPLKNRLSSVGSALSGGTIVPLPDDSSDVEALAVGGERYVLSSPLEAYSGGSSGIFLVKSDKSLLPYPIRDYAPATQRVFFARAFPVILGYRFHDYYAASASNIVGFDAAYTAKCTPAGSDRFPAYSAYVPTSRNEHPSTTVANKIHFFTIKHRRPHVSSNVQSSCFSALLDAAIESIPTTHNWLEFMTNGGAATEYDVYLSLDPSLFNGGYYYKDSPAIYSKMINDMHDNRKFADFLEEQCYWKDYFYYNGVFGYSITGGRTPLISGGNEVLLRPMYVLDASDNIVTDPTLVDRADCFVAFGSSDRAGNYFKLSEAGGSSLSMLYRTRDERLIGMRDAAGWFCPEYLVQTGFLDTPDAISGGYYDFGVSVLCFIFVKKN